MEIETKTKRWGSSIGIVLPKTLVEEAGIKPNDIIVIEVKKRLKVKEVFGLFPRTSKKTAQQIKDEIRAGW